MSYIDYTDGQAVELHCLRSDIHFYAVIHCAMRMADTDNLAKLKEAWPKVYDDLLQRYNAPCGRLPEKDGG